MSSDQKDKLLREFAKLKALESDNAMLVENIMYLNERLKYKENLRGKLMKMCSEKISKKNDTIESLNNENQHLQGIVNNQNEQIIEQEKTIERLQNSVNIQTTVIKHPCFESNKVKTKKETKSKVRFPHLNLTISSNRKLVNEFPNVINGNRRRRKLYNSDDETVDLSMTHCRNQLVQCSNQKQ